MNNLIADSIFGIDPGKSGAMTKYKDIVEVWNMPGTMNDLFDFFEYQKSICKDPLIFIEKVQLWHSDNDRGKQFRIKKMLDHYAELRSAFASKGFRYIEVNPIKWQSYLNIRIKGEDYGIRKKRYKDIAKDIFPQIKVTLHNSDALLILEYGRKMIKYNHLEVIRDIKKIEKSRYKLHFLVNNSEKFNKLQ